MNIIKDISIHRIGMKYANYIMVQKNQILITIIQMNVNSRKRKRDFDWEEEMEGRGFIYCLSNIAYGHNVFKIGYTMQCPFTRMNKLYTSGVPFPFILEFAKEVEEPYEIEKMIHTQLCEFRMNNNREFFRISIEIVRSLFDNIRGIYYYIHNEVHTLNTCINAL